MKKDLVEFETQYKTAPLSTQGQISVSITGLNRTINEINDLIQKEPSTENKQKFEKRLTKFRSESSDLKLRFEAAKARKDEDAFESNKSELLNRSSRTNPLASVTTSTDNPYSAAPGGGSGMSFKEGMYKEKNSLERSSQQLDEILEMGQRSFDDIVIQNEYLIKFEKKLSSSLVTLGVSRGTIQKIERRVFKDRFVFFGGAIVTVASFYFIYKYLG